MHAAHAKKHVCGKVMAFICKTLISQFIIIIQAAIANLLFNIKNIAVIGKTIDTRHCGDTTKSQLDPSKTKQNKISIVTKHNYTRFDQYMKNTLLTKHVHITRKA